MITSVVLLPAVSEKNTCVLTFLCTIPAINRSFSTLCKSSEIDQSPRGFFLTALVTGEFWCLSIFLLPGRVGPSHDLACLAVPWTVRLLYRRSAGLVPMGATPMFNLMAQSPVKVKACLAVCVWWCQRGVMEGMSRLLGLEAAYQAELRNVPEYLMSCYFILIVFF